MSENNLCPCCGRHCDLSSPKCERGKEYISTGIIPERKHEHKRPDKANHAAHYEALDTDSKLIMNLRDLGHMNRFHFEGKGSQKRILTILNEVGIITQRELTERIGVQPGSASEVIAKLEDAGLIERTQSTTDRRTTDIQLTEAGKIQAEEAECQRKERHQEMFSCLTPEEKEMFLTLLEKVSSDWKHRYRENKAAFDKSEENDDHGRHGHHHGHHDHHHDSHGHHNGPHH